MASYKSEVRAYINNCIRAEFPAERIAQLGDSLVSEVERWCSIIEDAVPRDWSRDWDRVALKYAIAFLRGDGIIWETPPKEIILWAGSPEQETFSVASLPTKFVIGGQYVSSKGCRIYLRRFYTPEFRESPVQGEASHVLRDGKYFRLHWKQYGPNPKFVRNVFSDEDIMGDCAWR